MDSQGYEGKIGALGGDCWLEEKDLAGGDIIAADIIRGVHACDEAIVLISPNSVKSQWVPFEIGAVRAQSKRVTPILNNGIIYRLQPDGTLFARVEATVKGQLRGIDYPYKRAKCD